MIGNDLILDCRELIVRFLNRWNWFREKLIYAIVKGLSLIF